MGSMQRKGHEESQLLLIITMTCDSALVSVAYGMNIRRLLR